MTSKKKEAFVRNAQTGIRSGDVLLREKSPRQGCTTQKTELGMHQNPNFHLKPLKINKNPKNNTPSTIKNIPYF